MLFALDYDGTFDKNPDFWLDFIEKATEYRIVVVIVTARPKDQIEDIVAAVPWNMPIYATGLTPKRAYMEEQGLQVDVWIDDWPEWICGCVS